MAKTSAKDMMKAKFKAMMSKSKGKMPSPKTKIKDNDDNC